MALLLCVWCAPASAGGNVTARVFAGGGFDTNARRDYQRDAPVPDTGIDCELTPEPGVCNPPVTDAVVMGIGTLEGRYTGERSQAIGAFDIGSRGFLQYPTESVLVTSALGETSFALGRFFGAGIEGRAKDRRGGGRDYTDLAAFAFAEIVPDSSVDVRLRAGAHRFIYWQAFPYSFSAPELGGEARYRFDRRHSVFGVGEIGSRKYNSDAQPRPPTDEERDSGEIPQSPGTRRDFALLVGAGYSYRGPFAFSVAYHYGEQASNSFGETTLRHRLTATGGFRLPWKLMLLAQLAVQLSSYPDGVLLSPEIVLKDDDEAHNSASLKLIRPISEHLEVELRVAAYHNRLAQNGFTYFRTTGWLGLAWRL